MVTGTVPGIAVDTHAQRVAHQDHVDAGGLLEGGRRVVVGGEPGDLLARALHLGELEDTLLRHRYLLHWSRSWTANASVTSSSEPGQP